ncbi:MAG: hypothetical protein E7055_04140 [Lentisphaerae bacterium]|nr:hypothetical protein [Lentisphaerota bacterium]
MPEANYILNSLLSGIIILAAGLLPWLVTVMLLQLVSNAIRDALSQLLGVNAYIYLSKRPARYMSQAFSEKIRDFLKNYLDSGFQNGGSRESI